MRGCQWIGPDQDPREGPIHYCGKTTLTDKSYCHEHYWQVFARGTSTAGRRKEREIDEEIAELRRLEELELDELENDDE